MLVGECGKMQALMCESKSRTGFFKNHLEARNGWKKMGFSF
jgi:hypothetical protein